jgi:predicted HTH domain antitoxin
MNQFKLSSQGDSAFKNHLKLNITKPRMRLATAALGEPSHSPLAKLGFVFFIAEIRFDNAYRTCDSFSMSTVQVELPEELFALANVSGTPSRSASKIIALELFRERRISAGKAAELAGVALDEFLDFAARREVPLHYTAADWEQDQATARKLNL